MCMLVTWGNILNWVVLLLVSDSTVVSSCEESERIYFDSQASETNVPTASHGCASGEDNVSSVCTVCNKKPRAVRLKVKTSRHCPIFTESAF